MFRHLKSNGFDLECLHVQKAYKVQMMKMIMAVLVPAYTLAVVYGLEKYRRRHIALKKHGAAKMSVFRYSLDLWQNPCNALYFSSST